MNEEMKFNYQHKLEQLKEYFGFDFVGLALVQPAENQFSLKWEYSVGNISNRYKKVTLQSGKGVAGTVFKTGKAMLVQEVEELYGKSDLFTYPIVVAENIKSFGAIPLYKYNRVKGVLLVGYREEKRMTCEEFERLNIEIGPRFGPFYNKEMVKH
ncbi:GAF domain-containing protein [Sporosarcina siberiensis]|uniref:GAF domain-containing protein n=1 Tax=Sporosarcina siberiensis TaxID=1365606 RepID=A0ABW4SF48_9BACL